MLKPVKMSKIRAICLKQAAPSVIKELQNLSAVHLKDAALPETERAGPLSSYDDISARLIRIRSMKESLGKTGKTAKKKYEFEKPLREADELLSESDKLQELLKAKEDLSRELDGVLQQQKSLIELEGMHIDFSYLNASSLQFALVKSTKEKLKTAEMLLPKRKNCSFVVSGTIILVAIPKSEDAKFLEGFGTMMPLPQLSGTPKQEISELKKRESSIHEKIAAAQGKLQRFSDAHYPRLAALEESLSIEADRAKISTMFSATESLYYIEGWVEHSRFKHVALELHRHFGRKIHVYDAGMDEHKDSPPTLRSNAKQAKPFQFVVELISLPQYSEIDPTMLLVLIVPLFYALILGDAGYAVLSFLLASYFAKKSQQGGILNQVSLIWMLSAIPTFFLGVAFDEWFGFSHTHLLEKLGFTGVQLYEGFHRVSSIETLMLLTIIIGTVHLALGFILGAINEWHHSRKHAAGKLAWLGIEISGFFLVAIFMFSSFLFLAVQAIALFVASVAVLIWSEGPIAAIEIPGLASNIMSYIRIAAVGLGGLILAETINELLFPRIELSLSGIFFFALTAAAYVALHAASCLVGMFESFIHGARLNVVEFFAKFYKGSGTQFIPFRAQRELTQES